MDDLAVRADDAQGIAKALTRGGELDVGENLAWHQAGCVLEVRSRLAGASERKQARTGQQARRTKRCVELRRRAELTQGVGMTAALTKNDPEIVMDEGALAAAAEDVPEGAFRGVELAGLEMRHSLRETLRKSRLEVLRANPNGRQQDNDARRG
jgi:hypothetical protein